MAEHPDKLHVPDPDDVGPDGEGPLETLALAGVLSIMCMLGIAMISVRESPDAASASRKGASSGTDTIQTSSSTETSSPSSDLRAIAQELAGRPKDQLHSVAWTHQKIDAVLTHGTRDVAEAACRSLFSKNPPVSPAQFRADLLSLVDRNAEHAPWSCLWHEYFDDHLAEGSGLRDTLREIWASSIRLFRPVDAPLVSVIVQWHPKRRGLPDDPRIEPWLRLCALQYDYQAAPACQHVLKGLAPDQGADLLMTANVHLARTEPLNPTYDLPLVIDGLGALADRGQPVGWRILETDVMPDYDADIRLGAAWFLCRMVNSPNDAVARQASEELTNAAGYSARMVSASLRRRWLRSCKLAFQTGGTDDNPKAPALAVWNGESDSAPDYTIESAIERGDCLAEGPEPRWYCAVRQFNGSQVSDLDDFFVQSRGLESHDGEW